MDIRKELLKELLIHKHSLQDTFSRVFNAKSLNNKLSSSFSKFSESDIREVISSTIKKSEFHKLASKFSKDSNSVFEASFNDEIDNLARVLTKNLNDIHQRNSLGDLTPQQGTAQAFADIRNPAVESDQSADAGARKTKMESKDLESCDINFSSSDSKKLSDGHLRQSPVNKSQVYEQDVELQFSQEDERKKGGVNFRDRLKMRSTLKQEDEKSVVSLKIPKLEPRSDLEHQHDYHHSAFRAKNVPSRKTTVSIPYGFKTNSSIALL